MIPLSVVLDTSGLARAIPGHATFEWYFGFCFGASCTFCFGVCFCLKFGLRIQGHLIDSQLFVFWIVFVFVVMTSHVCKEGVKRDFKNPYNFLLACHQVFERLMCEVEFWEVFLRKEQEFFSCGSLRSTC
jgi:hypothetical protein